MTIVRMDGVFLCKNMLLISFYRTENPLGRVCSVIEILKTFSVDIIFFLYYILC